MEKIRNIRLFQESTLAGLEAELQRHLILQNVVLIDQSVLLIVSTILYIFIINVKKNPKGQARIDNLETVTTFDTNNRTKTNKANNIIHKSVRTITQGLAKGNQYLLPIKHPSCY